MIVPQVRLWIGFLAALALSILPMPELISGFRPPWVLLFVVYIEYFLPGNFKLISLVLVGLFLDVLLSSVIGEHSFALLLVTWIASSKSRRFQFFSMIQQICLIGFFCLLYQFCIVFIDSLLGLNYRVYMPFTSALMGMFIWPWIRILGDSSLFIRLIYR
ncbi:rod shape-determining protein MreD [Legionella waltersii]|uniref:Rod shape-determining protein MreD n=1 Tax=Legionella waltersii TaxID=66969 RepID=A0A0W1ANG4_9GAMM|nr:rod shape-determining protein MreD [Legionella waltersii]KTD82802.1 rod shape-determining protein MreD [Legionella waltersii]SNV01439.1 rod shape determining protein MreD [Legionella waltersii]